MSEQPLIERHRAVVRELLQLAEERARAESEVATALQSGREAADAEFKDAVERISTRYDTEKEAAETAFQEANQTITERFETDYEAVHKEYEFTRNRIIGQAKLDKEKAETDFEESRWATTTELEAGKKAAETKLEEEEARVRAALEQVHEVQESARGLLAHWGRLRELADLPVKEGSTRAVKDPFQRLESNGLLAEQRLEELKALTLPRWFRGNRLAWLLVLAGVLVSAPAVLMPTWYYWLGGSIPVSALVGAGVWYWLFSRARAQVLAVYRPLCRALADAEAAGKLAREALAAQHKKEIAACTRRCHEELRLAKEKYQPLIDTLDIRRDADLRWADEHYQPELGSIEARRDEYWKKAHNRYQKQLAQCTDSYETDSHLAEERHAKQLEALKARHQHDWQALAERWTTGLEHVRNEVAAITDVSRRYFLDWNGEAPWVPPQAIPPGLRLGEQTLRFDLVPHGLPKDERLRAPVPVELVLPAHLAFPRNGSLLLEAGESGRAEAVRVLQAAMLRYLTSLPPGKVRFTIIDPVGLGENFAAFMHLADFDEALVTSRIWTEPTHIDQRLADLTEHMGNVIQKYLRNQFPSIEEYNVQAGEVAEPYRVLVVANFPVNFTPEAARRLLSVAASGPACGVYTLLSHDTRQQAPEGFNRADLEQGGVKLVWKGQRFVWDDPDLGRFPLALDEPPAQERFTQLLQEVGEKARDARRVEVGFDFVAPPAEQWWDADSRKGLNVALGRAGATRRQLLQLGHGTAQHVLIAGKTGSGKSTLLHALITNLALTYSPEEVELYLVDFKKGVEFKTYAVHELPHARVVAIESEREFGLSVLQRLDAELKARGERFRTLGVSDLAGFRQATNNAPCPRVLLIVDEFQEFFVEDDRIAQEAALLLDRLVRQGRAFGMHILLGSQTLGGAYTLARSTIDQMAVRIALQCSDADAHLILSKDNAAARLLSRPGEAIYNDANGLLEGNNVFQVVWLDDSHREEYLTRVQDMARRRHFAPSRPQIVFEGNARADVSRNHLLDALLRAPSWPATPRAASAWVGEPVAIKDPTAAVFRPQSASNLLILGQQEESALGILATALLGLAAQHAPGSGVQFTILDGTPVDSPHAGFLARVAELLPHPVRVASWRDVPAALGEVAAEASRRETEHETDLPPRYLFIHGLHAFRDLRKSDDDFGFSRRGDDKPANPSKLLANLLREGPMVHVHTLAWCDTVANAQRSLDRAGMREFDMRVLFQMSATDSSNLIDTPAASKLGLHHALFTTEDRAHPEKFRPYGLPADEWLAWVRERFREREAVTAP